MKIRPLHNQVIIQRDAAKTETSAGIALPDTTREQPCMGTVIATGPGAVSELTGNLLPMGCRKGDRVAFPQFAGQAIPGTERCIVVAETELLAVLDEGEEIS